MTPRVLVAGVGNIFLSDDGFGVEVARRLAGESFPEGVKVADFGIRSVHLAYELLDGYDALILIDAMGHGEAPGTVSVLEPERPDENESGAGGSIVDAHGMSPGAVLSMVSDMGGQVERVLVVGCEPQTLEENIGLSPVVESVVDQAVQVVSDLVREMSELIGEEENE
jgi:hydrogenase maturation protease